METPVGKELERLRLEIDRIPELEGVGIAFVGDGACTVLRRSRHRSGLATYVLLKESELDDQEQFPSAGDIPKPNLQIELVSMGLNCAGAVLAWAALGAEGLAAPASGGTSLGLVVLTWSAAISTSVQCGAALVRSTDVLVNQGQWTTWLDSQEFYTWEAMPSTSSPLLVPSAPRLPPFVPCVRFAQRPVGRGARY